MDLESLKKSTELTFFVKIAENPDTKEEVGFVVVGSSSEQYRQADIEVRALNIKESAIRKGAPMDLTQDAVAREAVEGADARTDILLKRCVVGWQGFKVAGQPAEFNEANLSAVFRMRRDWARRCLIEIENDANFLEG